MKEGTRAGRREVQASRASKSQKASRDGRFGLSLLVSLSELRMQGSC